MKNITIDRVDMNSIRPELLKQWAECYCEIWKEAPWNEDFWKPEDVITDFRKEMRYPHAVAFLAVHEGVVVGFTQGYSVDSRELQAISGSGLLGPIFEGRERVFYVDELGVAKQYRGNRISIALTSALLDSIQTIGIKSAVLRTDTKALAARNVYEKMGFMELNVSDAVHPERTYWLLDMGQRKFMDLFRFDPAKALFVGIEREAFLTNFEGKFLPSAPTLMGAARYPGEVKPGVPYNTVHDERIGYELSCCQVESRTGPCQLANLSKELLIVEDCLNQYIESANSFLGMLPALADWMFDYPDGIKVEKIRLSYDGIGPENMSLDVYPDPKGRYREIVKAMPRHILLAACRIISTHIHIGMPDCKTALRVYNQVIKKSGLLCSLEAGSFLERLDIYRIVAPDCDPKPYADWSDFYRVACTKGFDNDPRKCWTLVRISKHGTIEFRMFGATSSIDRIVGWAKICHDLCAEAMA